MFIIRGIGGPSAATLLVPAGPPAVGDHLQRDSMSKSPNEFSIETHKKTTPTKIIKKNSDNVLAPLEEPYKYQDTQ